jgi:hypothetical protein
LVRWDTELKYIKLKDLFFVFLYGVLISILIGLIGGFINYFMFENVGFSFTFLLTFFAATTTGSLVGKQYEYPHIVYIVITGIFLVIQGILIEIVPMVIYINGFLNLGDLANPATLFPLMSIATYNMIIDFSLSGILTKIVIFVSTYLGLKRTY